MKESPLGRGKVEVSRNTELFLPTTPQRQHNLAEDGWTTLSSSMQNEDSNPLDPRGSWEANRQEESSVGRACDT